MPHLIVLHDLETRTSYWQHIAAEVVVEAGKGAKVLVCGTCMDARGLTEADLLDGANRSTMDELTQETVDADKVLVF